MVTTRFRAVSLELCVIALLLLWGCLVFGCVHGDEVIVGAAGDTTLLDVSMGEGDGKIREAPAMACNGSPDLCTLRFDESLYVTTHNAMSNAEDEWWAPNQSFPIPKQLADGVRGLMLDTHYEDDEPFLCHGYCILGSLPLVDGFSQIERYLQEDPGAVITLIFESYVSTEDTVSAFVESGLDLYVHTQSPDTPWPTLGEMVSNNTRLVVLADHAENGPAWYHLIWDLAWETDWHNRSIEDFDCQVNRGSIDNSLFLMNHFVADPLPLPEVAEVVNGYRLVTDRIQECAEHSDRLPNFIAVDFYSLGHVLDVAASLNAKWAAEK